MDGPKLIKDVTRFTQSRECLSENTSEEDRLDKRLFKERMEKLTEQDAAIEDAAERQAIVALNIAYVQGMPEEFTRGED